MICPTTAPRPPLPQLSDELTLAKKVAHRSRQMQMLADFIVDTQARGEDVSWVPGAAATMLAGVARDMAKWSAEIEP